MQCNELKMDTALRPTVNISTSAASRPGGTLEVDPVSGELRPVRDDSPRLPGLQLSLQPGSARLLAWV